MQEEKSSILTTDQNTLARIDRFAIIFPGYLQRLEEESGKIRENLPKITLEIEEFKKVQNDFIPALREAVKEASKEERKGICEAVMKDLNSNLHAALLNCREQAKEIHQKALEDAALFKKNMEAPVVTLQSLLALQKQRLTYRGLLICAVFCLSSMLTGIGLYCFFPQHIYYSDPHTARNIIMGRSAWDNIKHLSPKDQGLLLEGMKKYMEIK